MSRIPIAKPVVTKEMVEASSNALANERLVMGESVFKFEEEFAKYVGTDHAVSVSSGTDALVLAMLACDVRNKEVVTTPFSFVATATSIVHAGAIPAFSDISPDYNLDPSALRGAVKKETIGALPVHLYGCPSRMEEISEAMGKGKIIIEDACQAHGAVYKGKKVGAMGDVGCFSFYPTKNMTVGGDGGVITTNDRRLASDIAKLRDCGRISRYEHDVFGFTSRLNSCSAAFGRVQLRYLDEWNERRRTIARRYEKNLKDVTQITLPPMGSNDIKPVFHLFPINCADRDLLANYLAEKGIDTAVHYPIPIHQQPIYRNVYGYKGGEYPVSERNSQRMLSIPMFPEMTDMQVDEVSEAIIGYFL